MHGQARLVRELGDEIRRRLLERDLQRAVVDGLDAEFLDLGLALVDLLAVLDACRGCWRTSRPVSGFISRRNEKTKSWP